MRVGQRVIRLAYSSPVLSIAEWLITVQKPLVEVVPGEERVSTVRPDGVVYNDLYAFLFRKLRWPNVFTIRNISEDKEVPIFLKFVPESWNYNRSPEMGAIELLRVSLVYEGAEYVQFEISNGMVTVPDGRANAILLKPGTSATCQVVIKLGERAGEGDIFGFRLEVIALPPSGERAETALPA